MADISMCANGECPRRQNCYRAMAKPSAWQSWIGFSPDASGECSSFIKCENFARADIEPQGAAKAVAGTALADGSETAKTEPPQQA